VAYRVETREEVKKTTGHVIPSRSIVHVGPDTHVFNGSDHTAYMEVAADGEMYVKPLASGQIIIWFGEEGS
jgi:hypothetical protein